jgi:hypothetical protein
MKEGKTAGLRGRRLRYRVVVAEAADKETHSRLLVTQPRVGP